MLHYGVVEGGNCAVSVADSVSCMVDYERRALVAPNHTMTHVLNQALRDVLLGDGSLGSAAVDPNADQVNQKGSSCDAERLRFDFSWDKPVSTAQARRRRRRRRRGVCCFVLLFSGV